MAGAEHVGSAVTGPRAPARWSVNAEPIERARVLNGWTRKHLAGIAHIDPKTLTDMCNGRRRPTFATLHAICTALGLTIAEAIRFEEEDSDAP